VLSEQSLLPTLLTPAWAPFAAALCSFGLLAVVPSILTPFVRDNMFVWREETHCYFSASVQCCVVTALLCLNRVATLPAELRGYLKRSFAFDFLILSSYCKVYLAPCISVFRQLVRLC
jgi:hypothetical protein